MSKVKAMLEAINKLIEAGVDDLDMSDLPKEFQTIFDGGFKKAAAKTDGMKLELKKVNDAKADLLRKLTAKDSTISSTEEELQKYRDQLEEIENSGKSETQKLEASFKKERQSHVKALEEAGKLTDKWKTDYFSTIIRGQLMEAAVGAESYDPQQVLMMLTGNVRMDEVKDDDGNTTHVPSFYINDEDGKEVKSTIKEGVTTFLKANPNLLKSQILRDEEGKIDSLTLTDKDGKPVAVDLEGMSVDEINKNYEEIHKAIHSTSE